MHVDEDSHDIELEVNHEARIKEAVGRWIDDVCGTDPADHDWTSEGEGGLDENPGVWSLGGTKLLTREHCTRCGLCREETHAGSQRNPGEAAVSVRYELPAPSDEDDQSGADPSDDGDGDSPPAPGS